MKGTAYWLAAMPAIALTASAGAAQDTARASGVAATEVGEAAEAGLEDIVVTAQRRSESLQDVPIAITAITAATASQLGITNPEAVAQIVPGFVLTRSGQTVTPFLRGLGSNSNVIGNEPSVATFIDEVYAPTSNAAVFEFNNIEAVEVLKGPQGTLFGRNAAGGVLHIKTRNPSSEPAVDASIGYANYDTRTFQVYGTTGLTDGLAVNLSAYGSKQQDGWGQNVATGRAVLKGYGWGLRSKLLYDDGGDTTALVNLSFDRNKGSRGMAGRVVPGSFGRAGYSPEEDGAGFYDHDTDQDMYYLTDQYQGSLKLAHDFANARLVSITAYTRLKTFALYDIDGSPSPFFAAGTDQRGKTFTQEFQLLSPEGARVSWILGAFYLRDISTYIGDPYVGQAFGTARGFSQATQKTSSLSGFGQATAEILPRTNLTIGLRYTSDRRSARGRASLTASSGAVTEFGPFTDAERFSNVTGRFSIDHHPTPELMLYAAYNRGFKSGVYALSGIAPGSRTLPPPARPEEVDAYSAGFKWELLGRRLRINAEGYYYDYKNIQVQNSVAGGTILTNGGAATLKGLEIEAQARPIENLTIGAALAFAHGRYDAFPGGLTFFPLPPNAPVAIPPGCTGVPPYPAPAGAAPSAQRSCDLSGKKTIQTPPFSSNVSASYRLDSGVGPFDLGLSWAHGGNFYFGPDNDPNTRQPKTDIVNATLQWTARSEAFAARLWVNNLLGERYYTYVAQSAVSGVRYSPAPPRTYGVTLSAHF